MCQPAGPTPEEKCAKAERFFDVKKKVCTEKCADSKLNQFNKKLSKCVPKPPKKVEVKAFSIEIKKKECTDGEEWHDKDEKCKTKITKKSVTITITEETPKVEPEVKEEKPKMSKKEVK